VSDRLVLALFSVFLCFWYRRYFSDAPIPSVDLPAHIAIVERLAEQLRHGNLFFYDPAWFTGWPAFQFYAFVPHLVVAALSYPLAWVSQEQARLAVHLVLVLGVAALPFSVAYAARPLYREVFAADEKLEREHEPLVAVVVGTLTFWFLNRSGGEFQGMGAAALMHMGLYAQLFGWHLMMLHVGALYRVLDSPNGRRGSLSLIASTALIVLSHTLSAAFSLLLAALSWLRFAERRRQIFFCHACGIGLSAFWLVPAVSLSADFTTFDVEYSTGDFLHLLTGASLLDAHRSLQQWTLGGISAIHLMPFILPVLLIAMAGLRELRRASLLPAFFLFGLILVLVLGSNYVAASFPLPFHYYRFLGLSVFFVLHILAIVPIAFVKRALVSPSPLLWGPVSRVATLTLSASVFFASVTVPHPEHLRLNSVDPFERFAFERAVLDYFRARKPDGRVLFEYFKNFEKFDPISPHYLSSRLHSETGWETVNGLFVQSSLAVQFAVANAAVLDLEMYGEAYHQPQAQVSREIALRELQGLGVTYAVVSEAQSLQALRARAVEPPVRAGPFHILRIGREPFQPVTEVRRPLVGYLDLRGNLPFKFLEFYFSSSKELTEAFELVALESPESPLPDLGAVIVNGDRERALSTVRRMSERLGLAGPGGPEPPAIVHVDYEPNARLDPYKPVFYRNIEEADYRAAARKLDSVISPEVLDGGRNLDRRSGGFTTQPSLTWDEDHQGFTLTGLVPGRMVRVNYAYFPYWRSQDGAVFRGSEERILFLPAGTSARLEYSRYRSRSSWIGVAISMISAAAIVAITLRTPRSRRAAAGGYGRDQTTSMLT
jgi:hypothetical protein